MSKSEISDVDVGKPSPKGHTTATSAPAFQVEDLLVYDWWVCLRARELRKMGATPALKRWPCFGGWKPRVVNELHKARVMRRLNVIADIVGEMHKIGLGFKVQHEIGAIAAEISMDDMMLQLELLEEAMEAAWKEVKDTKGLNPVWMEFCRIFDNAVGATLYCAGESQDTCGLLA